MAGRNKTRLIGWHPSDPALVDWLDAEIERCGGGRGAQSAILDEALAGYRARRTAIQDQGDDRGAWYDAWAKEGRDGDGNLILRHEPTGGQYKVIPVEEQ